MEKLQLLWDKILHILVNSSWWSKAASEIILLSILGYIVLLLLLLFIHRKIIKKHKKIHKNIVFLYDSMRYQVSKAQYGNPGIQENAGINIVIKNEHKDYLHNTITIKEEISKIEQQIGQQIVTEEQRKNINKQIKKKKWTYTIMQIIGRITTSITAGIYKLFW